MTDYTYTIGTVGEDRKVHLAHGTTTQRILCRFRPHELATTTTLAKCPEDGDICDVLLAADVKVSRLCANCFPPKTRARYKERIRRAIAELS